MQFYHNDLVTSPATLHRRSFLPPTTSYCLLSVDSIALFHDVSVLPLDTLASPMDSTHRESLSLSTNDLQRLHGHPPNLLALLQEFGQVFSVPSGLPPLRPHDHHIDDPAQLVPCNVRPYPHPHCRKEMMAKLVSDMLRDGRIRPSTSPYSSSVLLVLKKGWLVAFFTKL